MHENIVSETIGGVRIRDGVKLLLNGEELLEVDNGTNVLYSASIDDIANFTIDKLKDDIDRLPSIECFSVDRETGTTKLSSLVISELGIANGIVQSDSKGRLISLEILPAETTLGARKEKIATHDFVNSIITEVKDDFDSRMKIVDSLASSEDVIDSIVEVKKYIDRKIPNPESLVSFDFVNQAVEDIKNYVISKVYDYSFLATHDFVNNAIAKIREYIDRKTFVHVSSFIYVKNVAQNNVTGDGSLVIVTYGEKKTDIGNDFDGTYYIAKANCIAEFKIGCVLNIKSGFNSSYAVQLVKSNKENVEQEIVILDSGLVSSNEDADRNVNVLGKTIDVMMLADDKAFVRVVVKGNSTKNVSLLPCNYQRFSGRVTNWL